MSPGDYVRHTGLDETKWVRCLWQLVDVGPDYVQADLVVGTVPPWAGPNRRMTLWKRHLVVVETLDALVAGL